MTLPTQNEKPNGLHQRYCVTKANGDPVDPDAVYFVLRIDGKGDDFAHQKACIQAIRTYAFTIQMLNRNGKALELAELAWDLHRRAHEASVRLEITPPTKTWSEPLRLLSMFGFESCEDEANPDLLWHPETTEAFDLSASDPTKIVNIVAKRFFELGKKEARQEICDALGIPR